MPTGALAQVGGVSALTRLLCNKFKFGISSFPVLALSLSHQNQRLIYFNRINYPKRKAIT